MLKVSLPQGEAPAPLGEVAQCVPLRTGLPIAYCTSVSAYKCKAWARGLPTPTSWQRTMQEKPQPLDLLSLLKTPSLPLAWGNPDKGTLFAWGDFYLVLAIDAPMFGALNNPEWINNPPMRYPYSLIAFYHQERSPHGPSARPVLAVTLEQVTAAGKRMMAQGKGDPDGPPGPPMLCAFTSGAHLNYGPYPGELREEPVIAALIEKAREHLPVVGDPVPLGKPADAYGHPATGMPKEKPKISGARNSGCAGRLVALVSLGAVLAAMLSE